MAGLPAVLTRLEDFVSPSRMEDNQKRGESHQFEAAYFGRIFQRSPA